MEVYVFTERAFEPLVLYACNSFLEADNWVNAHPDTKWTEIKYRYHNCEPFRLYRANPVQCPGQFFG